MSENNSTAPVAVKQKSTVVEKLGKFSLIGTGGFLALPASAALDVTSLTTEIASNGDSMQTVMLAVLTLVALFVGYRMIKRSMS